MTQRYTLSEVAANNGRNGAPIWLVHKDSVYDVTPYINEHPGGIDAMLSEGGKDATKVFEDIHSSDAKDVLRKFKIGEIVEEEKKYDANGKKKKRVVSVPPEKEQRSFCHLITCGLVG